MFAALVLSACLAAGTPPAVAILIDDIGYRVDADLAALGLPGAYSYAILPHTPHGARFARAATALARDALLHLPMEAERGNALLGPGSLRLGMDAPTITDTLEAALASLPTVVGLNNHMGSRLTADRGAMQVLATGVARHRGLFFVDSRTTARTTAAQAMRERGVPTLERDVFLDHVPREQAVQRQLAVLVARARRVGHALGIAHPHRETLSVLRAWRPDAAGVRLVPVSTLFAEPLQVETMASGECAARGNERAPGRPPRASKGSEVARQEGTQEHGGTDAAEQEDAGRKRAPALDVAARHAVQDTGRDDQARAGHRI